MQPSGSTPSLSGVMKVEPLPHVHTELSLGDRVVTGPSISRLHSSLLCQPFLPLALLNRILLGSMHCQPAKSQGQASPAVGSQAD